jgi:sulfatase modifying factor 1
MISMDDIQRWDALLKAKQALFLLDACFGGLAGTASKSDNRELKIDQLDQPAHHLVSAGAAEEQTIAGDRWGGSIFADAVLRAVRGEADAETSYPKDGVVSLSELVSYVKLRVAIEAPAAGWTKPIIPQLRDLGRNTGEFFFLTNERKLATLGSSGGKYQSKFEFGVPVVDHGIVEQPPATPGDADSGRDGGFSGGIGDRITTYFEGFLDLFRQSALSPDEGPGPGAELDPTAQEAGLNLHREGRLAVQEALTALGFDTRGIDGVFGPNTRKAIAGWQSVKREAPTGYLTSSQYEGLLAEAEPKLAALAAAQKPEHASPAQPSVGVYKQPSWLKAGDEFRDCEECPLMVVVPAGSFMMGSTDDWKWFKGISPRSVDREKPHHPVTIERPFAVGKYEVTVGQFEAFVKATDHVSRGCLEYAGDGVWKVNASKNWRVPGFEQTDGHPVVCVYWDDAKRYVAWLSEKTRQQYRLLSEAEWEYAARAGTTTMRPWGDDRDNKTACTYANGADLPAKEKFGFVRSMNCYDGHLYTASVGSYSANGFRLHDMLGNVMEWVDDCWHDSYQAARRPDDGRAWTTGDCRAGLVRGGSWNSDPWYLRSASRRGPVLSSDKNTGFRVARTLSRGESVAP